MNSKSGKQAELLYEQIVTSDQKRKQEIQEELEFLWMVDDKEDSVEAFGICTELLIEKMWLNQSPYIRIISGVKEDSEALEEYKNVLLRTIIKFLDENNE